MTSPRAIRFGLAEAAILFDPDSLALTWVRGPERGAAALPSDPPPPWSDATACRPELDRLTVCVSQACNMACRYCYAGGGGYGRPATLMSRATAIATGSWALGTFHSIRHLHFFGGEPSLNEPAVRLLCELFEFCAARGRLHRPPTFGMTTNGLRLQPSLLDTLERHRFSVTVSLDGPASIHDLLRPDRNRAPTHERILATIEALRGRGISPEFECTFTAEHLAAGLTPSDLLRYFADQLGCRVVHVPLVAGSALALRPEQVTAPWVQAVRDSVASLDGPRPRALSMVARWLRSLEGRRPIDAYCPAGTRALTVLADGTITSCFMLSTGAAGGLGSVLQAPEVLALRTSAAASVAPHDKWRHPECSRCWLQPLCFGCIGEDRAMTDGGALRSAEAGRAPLCDFRRSCGEAFFEALAARLAASQPG